MQRLFFHLHLAFAHEGRGPPFAQGVDCGMHNRHANGSGKAYRLCQPGFGRALSAHIANGAAGWLFEGEDDGGAGGSPGARFSSRRQKSPLAAK